MNDILPPKRPLNKGSLPPRPEIPQSSPQERPVAPRAQVSNDMMPPVNPLDTPQQASKKPRRAKRILLWIFGSIITLLLVAIAGLYLWYIQSLQPANPGDQAKVRVDIVEGSTPMDIGQLLEEKKLIKNKYAFDIYTRVTDTRGKLQAGTYSLSPSESVQAMVEHLVSGKVDSMTITFLPGATLAENRNVLLKAGYSETEVDAALNRKYDHPLFQDKPADADLEGYIWGETYTFGSGASAEAVLLATFDHYYEAITEDKLVDAFRQQNLNLFQGITLASVIQREVPGVEDQKQVAQVFLTRLSIDMPLGADATYKYAAKKMGVDPTPELNSPYNTRKFKGLPPGPIATPGRTALQAVAQPATGDYLYFVSGDDELNYFSRTFEEHEMNIEKHCQKKCSVL